ncbi:Putative lipid carrier protein-like protein [Magnetococcus marinus MC-1]|uniref:Multifunctional fusion protein n=1 Tax=Magnetococcus marinus (strain ATCC BAA-1437 / JCM 17883 / MC-1) TaxID=156889 RepID=A0LDD5_MAGMM|nr:SCP2 sterol-binding domain-containing protein [Magnetococcus marinus]ABK45978.1 Putative lipid carrier protein-like protein [Magnetococcus marinus MC-1]
MFVKQFAAPLALLPQPFTAVGLGVTLNLFFMRYPELKARLQELAGKLFHFAVEDLGQDYYMLVEQDGHVRIHTYSDAPVNVTMSGSAEAFLQLLFNVEDPDSLFFARRLKMSGETETGLHFKNILDNVAIDWEREAAFFIGPIGAKLAGGVGSRLKALFAMQKESAEESAEMWLDENSVPRRHDVDDLQDQCSDLSGETESLERRLTRLENRYKMRQAALRAADSEA